MLADEVADRSLADQLPMEKTREAPFWCSPALIWLSSGVQSICDAEKVSARHFEEVFKVTFGKYKQLKIQIELI